MLPRHARQVGLRLIEAALEKSADIYNPSSASLKAKKTRELNHPPAPVANIPKVVSLPAV